MIDMKPTLTTIDQHRDFAALEILENCGSGRFIRLASDKSCIDPFSDEIFA